jgi:exopolyphosphatase/guanosine-5'-triphosphate,3'-diphosphate pyrophosphatase
MSNYYAAVDLGTNTFQLLVASQDPVSQRLIIHENIQRAVQLGKGAMEDQLIQPEAWERARLALVDFQQIVEKYQISKVTALGTSIIRNAKNAQQLIAFLEKESGFEVLVISGEKEAELIFQGIVQSLPTFWEPISLVMDIGGGSVEFILFSERKIIWRGSFEIGGLKLQSLFHLDNEFHKSTIDPMRDFVKRNLQDLFEQVKRHPPTVLIGAAGAFETIWDLEKAENGSIESGLDSFQKLDIEIFRRNKRLIEALDFDDRVNIPGMKKFRASIFPYANLLIDLILNELNISQLYMSNFSLKEGFICSNLLSRPSS